MFKYRIGSDETDNSKIGNGPGSRPGRKSILMQANMSQLPFVEYMDPSSNNYGSNEWDSIQN